MDLLDMARFGVCALSLHGWTTKKSIHAGEGVSRCKFIMLHRLNGDHSISSFVPSACDYAVLMINSHMASAHRDYPILPLLPILVRVKTASIIVEFPEGVVAYRELHMGIRGRDTRILLALLWS